MKLFIENFKGVSLLFLLLIGLASCQDENEPVPNENQEHVKLESTARGENEADPQARKSVGAFFVSDFEVGTKDVEMKYAAQADLAAGIGLGNITLKSNVNTSLGTSASTPKSLVLISNGEARIEVIGEGETPEGKYTEVQLNLYKNTEVDEDHHMFEKSLLVRGEVQGTPTWVWLDVEKELRAEAEGSDGFDVEQENELMVVFDMVELFNGVDFELAADGNADGRIDISPDNNDGNLELYNRIESNLDAAVKFERK